MYCIDASVLLSDLLSNEHASRQSSEFLQSVRQEEIKVFMPEHALAEIASGFYRVTKNRDRTRVAIAALRALSNYSFVPIDTRLATLAVDVVLATGLRGSDAIYVALAADYRLTLVTLDHEQLIKGSILVKTATP